MGKIADENNVLFFCDATQAVGKLPISVKDSSVDLMAFSSHKIYGPKGVGALYIKRKNRRIQLEPLLHGGGQESHLRAGTLNVPAIVGFGAAAKKAQLLMKDEGVRLAELRNYLEKELLQIEGSYLNGDIERRLPNVTNISFLHVKAEQLMASAPMIAMASGSACSTGSLEPSHVLLAMGLKKDLAHAALRLSLGRFNTTDEINQTIALLKGSIEKLRAESPIWMLYKKGVL